MSSDPDSIVNRIDAICGRTVIDGSPYRRFHGGVVFHFCSDECCGRFASELAVLEAVAAASRDGGTMMPTAGACAHLGGAPMIDPEAAGAIAAPRSSPNLGEGRAHHPARGPTKIEEMSPSLASERNPAFERLVPSSRRALVMRAFGDRAKRGARNVFAPFFAWQERRFAAAYCREMLELYWSVAAIHPGLSGRQLYRQIVEARSGGGALDVDAILECAEQSFASWPVTRTLNFRDVVHYMAVLEFTASHKNARWIHANMKWVMSAWIPHDL